MSEYRSSTVSIFPSAVWTGREYGWIGSEYGSFK